VKNRVSDKLIQSSNSEKEVWTNESGFFISKNLWFAYVWA